MSSTPTPLVGRSIHNYSSIDGASTATPESADRWPEHVERRSQVLYTHCGGRPYVVPYWDI
jgi:hypothetical protein